MGSPFLDGRIAKTSDAYSPKWDENENVSTNLHDDDSCKTVRVCPKTKL
jgi:hypothetical protein